MTPREREVFGRLMCDFEHYSARCVRIRTKAGRGATLTLNSAQRILHARAEAQLERTGRVRQFVLKGRQMGISTYIAGRFYWKVSHRKGMRAFILTHLDTATANLFEMAKRIHDNCPDLVRPHTGAANAKELRFDLLDSGYKVGTAGTAEVGRSDTIQYFHGSEVGFWPNAEAHSAGIDQAVANVDGSEDWRESTANGIGNAFHRGYKAAEAGDSDFEATFLPWFLAEEYRATMPEGFELNEHWREYQEVYGLDDEQLAWAWRKNRAMSAAAGGRTDQRCWKFMQEYPATSSEAFQTSGEDTFINPELVVRARHATGVKGYGPIILGVDPARGGGDKSAFIDRQGRLMGSMACEQLDIADTMQVARHAQQTAKRIGADFISVDTTGLGAGVYDRLKELIPDTPTKRMVRGVNFSSTAWLSQQFYNRRAEMWDAMRAWLEDPAGVQIPDNDLLHGQLCAPVVGPGATRFMTNGQLIIEKKEDIKTRLGFSPDLADAAALTFAEDWSMATRTDWSEDAAALPLGPNQTGYNWS